MVLIKRKTSRFVAEKSKAEELIGMNFRFWDEREEVKGLLFIFKSLLLLSSHPLPPSPHSKLRYEVFPRVHFRDSNSSLYLFLSPLQRHWLARSLKGFWYCPATPRIMFSATLSYFASHAFVFSRSSALSPVFTGCFYSSFQSRCFTSPQSRTDHSILSRNWKRKGCRPVLPICLTPSNY